MGKYDIIVWCTKEENNEEVNVEPNYILAAHRKGGIAELPEEAQKELDNYVEYLRAKYKK